MIQAETLELLEWSRLCQHLATFAATKLGKTAAHHLKIPTSIAASQSLLAQTQETYRLESLLAGGLAFDGIYDIGEALDRAERQGVLGGRELLEIATTLAGARQLRRIIDNHPDLEVLNALVADLRTYPELEQEIHRCIDDRGRVMDRANPRLEGIREQLRQVRERIYDQLQKIMQRHSNAIQETLITQRGERFVIPVKSSHKDVIPGIVHDTSTSGVTLYVEPHAIVNSGNQLRQLTRQEQREEEEVRRKLTEQVAAVKPDLEKLLITTTTLDLATARARYSLWLGANPPRFIHFGEPTQIPAPEPIVLRQLRHPLLVWQEKHEQSTPVVPIDLVIQPQIRVVAITGPNTGGKTVTLKTLALTVLMAKVGLFVPAREPVELPWFDRVLADIGDEQSLQQSLSTFSGHIRRISRILDSIGSANRKGEGALPRVLTEGIEKVRIEESTETLEELEEESEAEELQQAQALDSQHLDPEQPDQSQPYLARSSDQSKADSSEVDRSELGLEADQPAVEPPLANALVLLDEVGAGTDPSEGSALAIALLKYLAEHTVLTIATTHFGELKALKYQDSRFENASVEFDDVTLSPTYRLLWGIPGRSNALVIARRLGLKPEIIDQAKGQVGASAAQDVNQVIAGLEAQRRQQEEKAKTAAQLVQQAEQLHQEVSRKADLLKQRERELQQQQELVIQQELAQAKGEIAQVIRQLQQGTPTAQAAQQATETLNQIAEQRLPSRQTPAKPKPGFRPQVGNRVRIPRLGQTAEVIAGPDPEGELTVRFGLMKMTVSLADIESLQGEKPELPAKPALPPPAPPPVPAPAIRTSRNTIDIRGSRVADAEHRLEQDIAKAEAGPLWIIHGHGTGKLRQGVHEFLKQHPQIVRFEPAEPSDGGSGVTVAYVR